MKKICLLFVITIASVNCMTAQIHIAADLIGTWIIDLTPSPDAEPYVQVMEISAADGKTISGSFYNSPFENGETNSLWDKTYFAFTTKDRSSVYFTSGSIENGELRGVTYCDQRDFVMPWTGKRKELTK
ncbi:MAG: hypothetical protein AAFZ15_11275 [Bacteroidota bacterium]